MSENNEEMGGGGGVGRTRREEWKEIRRMADNFPVPTVLKSGEPEPPGTLRACPGL